jgi:DNA-binding winged helix-turn-helix (wHTH) protein/Tol biopolymer transport system component
MAKQYWVGEFFVDLSRNQISQLGQSQNLPPKALLVLTQLAENRGKVVSYDELLDKVWPNSVVTPNTLQRSIAQLRKALGENSKAQDIIKTHSKQGYSLECDVNWSDNAQPSVVPNTNTTTERPRENEQLRVDEYPESHDREQEPSELDAGEIKKSSQSSYWSVAVAAMLVIIVVLAQFQYKTPQLQFGDFRYITATDDKEFGGTYSPDGKYIVFRRYLDKLCINNIWAKNVDTLEEVQLTAELGTYGSHSLSTDGETLVFIKQEDCTKPLTQNTCYKLMSISFNDALSQPQQPSELLDCRNSAILSPVWIDDQSIVMMQKDDLYWKIIRYSLKDNTSSTLYEIDGGSVRNFTYSPENDLLAVVSIKNDGMKYIDMLSPDGELQSSHQIRLPPNTPRHLPVYPAFIPNTELLLFGGGRKLYTLSYDGEVAIADRQLDEGVGAPYFHPDGTRLLLVSGRYDSDVATLPIPKISLEEQQENGSEPSVFERSINHEDNARFQPNGNLIAFVSKRTGSEQVWLLDGDRVSVLSHFPTGTFLSDLNWSADGKSMLMLADFELQQLSLNKEADPIKFRYPVTRLFHWDDNKQHVIANILANGVRKFVRIDLNTMEFQIVNHKQVEWAVESQDGSLIFMDRFNRFWQEGAIEDKLIEPLIGQGSSKHFVVRNGLMYGINKQNRLWVYSLHSGDFTLLSDVTPDIDYLTDINDNELLVTVVIAAKKEVVELAVVD